MRPSSFKHAISRRSRASRDISAEIVLSGYAILNGFHDRSRIPKSGSATLELGNLLERGLRAGARPLDASLGTLPLTRGCGELAVGIRQFALRTFQVQLGVGRLLA